MIDGSFGRMGPIEGKTGFGGVGFALDGRRAHASTNL
jgi:hypothetical protein